MRFAFSFAVSALCFANSAVAEQQDVLPKCEAPASPFYAQPSLKSARDIELISDFKALAELSEYDKTKTFPAVIAVKQDGEKTQYAPVLLSRRGNSRNTNCSAPPLRISFVNETAIKKIESALKVKGIDSGSSSYLKTYYRQLVATPIEQTEQADAHGTGVFKGLGDDIKLVTHCGPSKDWSFVGAPTEAEQNLKLMSEFYVYKILDLFKAPVEFTRLAEITYYNPAGGYLYNDAESKKADGSQNHMKLAFFREPPKSLAKRCGLLSKAPTARAGSAAATPTPADSAASSFQAGFLNHLIMTNDWAFGGHNMNILYNARGTRFYGPYDYDLSEIFTDGYSGNLESDLALLRSFMLNGEAKFAVPMAKQTLALQSQIATIIQQSDLTPARRERFNVWLKAVVQLMHTTLDDKDGIAAALARESAQ